jgi:hypothetical protein
MFYRHDRSLRSSFIIGVSYTNMSTDTDSFGTMHAISIFPQPRPKAAVEEYDRTIQWLT